MELCWLRHDPLAEKFYNLSPQSFLNNNPLSFIDPTGMSSTDWFKDKKGVMQFDPKVKSQADLGNRGTYVGKTHKEISKSGGNVDYRKDGSILYANEKDAYTRVISNTIGTKREQFGVIGDKGVLVLPDYQNSGASGKTNAFGYSFKNGNLQDPISGQQFNTLGSIHAHLSGGGPSDYTGDGYGDLGFASGSTPFKPAFVMQIKPKGANTLSFVVAGSLSNSYVRDVTKSDGISADDIQKSVSLRKYVKTHNFKAILE